MSDRSHRHFPRKRWTVGTSITEDHGGVPASARRSAQDATRTPRRSTVQRRFGERLPTRLPERAAWRVAPLTSANTGDCFEGAERAPTVAEDRLCRRDGASRNRLASLEWPWLNARSRPVDAVSWHCSRERSAARDLKRTPSRVPPRPRATSRERSNESRAPGVPGRACSRLALTARARDHGGYSIVGRRLADGCMRAVASDRAFAADRRRSRCVRARRTVALTDAPSADEARAGHASRKSLTPNATTSRSVAERWT